nr:FHA domain-containing protein [Curtobacterium pusillum]
MLPDGAIFCGECGRAVTAAAGRRPAAPTPVEQAPPPPLQQPDVHGRRDDPATEAWLPEATLDPATRAWLTGADRRDEQPPAPVPVQRPADVAPRSAPTHVHGGGSGLSGVTGRSGSSEHASHTDTDTDTQRQHPAAEPPLDPGAYPSVVDEYEDPEVTRIAERPASAAVPDTATPDAATPDLPSAEAPAPVWTPPAAQEPAAAPAGPSWWVGRSKASDDQTDVASDAPAVAPPAGPPAPADADGSADTADAGKTSTDPGAAGSESARPTDEDVAPAIPEPEPARPGDTAVVEPLVDRRPFRPAPLVTPGSQASTCHVCGHRLEPDDIFCAECGAVRPAVTAAFTGPVVPLPMDRPDWAADDWSDDVDAQDDAVAQDDLVAQDDAESDTDPTPADEPDPLPDWINGGGDPVEDTPRTPSRPRGVHAAPSSEQPSGPEPTVPPVPGSATAPPSVPTPTGSAASVVPTAAPLPPLPDVTPTAAPLPPLPDGGRTAVPLPPADGAPTSADADLDDDGDLEDDVDETRIVSKTPTRAPFVLHFSTGERFGVHGTGLVGRLPRPQPGERFDDLLTVHDPGKSVSKTHLELGRDGDDLWVSDRFSGNGTVVRHIDGSIRRCEPGRRYRVERGARVDIGEQFFLVQ